jgi:hypothetical protein
VWNSGRSLFRLAAIIAVPAMIAIAAEATSDV